MVEGYEETMAGKEDEGRVAVMKKRGSGREEHQEPSGADHF